ncbi:hypothetical protein V7793_35530 [Streptomyces sp. KLMMK]|uniref:hypothetical protein n=1 Tax=Streptomyces sp. KLMMK TaxID=3109353 RepID=UPI00300A827E
MNYENAGLPGSVTNTMPNEEPFVPKGGVILPGSDVAEHQEYPQQKIRLCNGDQQVGWLNLDKGGWAYLEKDEAKAQEWQKYVYIPKRGEMYNYLRIHIGSYWWYLSPATSKEVSTTFRLGGYAWGFAWDWVHNDNQWWSCRLNKAYPCYASSSEDPKELHCIDSKDYDVKLRMMVVDS